MKPVPHYVLALAVAVPAVLIGVEIPSWLTFYHQTLAFHSDLRVFYTPGFMLRTGQRKEIYNFAAIRRNQNQQVAPDGGAEPYLHPAYEAVLFVPVSFLPYRAAYIAWAGVNFAILGLIFLLLRPVLSDLSAIGPKWMVPALLLGFMPIAFTIVEGQDSLFLLLILILVYRRVVSNELQAGLLLSLGMFRFQVLLPIIALFLLWRSLKFVAGWVAGSALVLGVSAEITGIGAQMQYMRILLAMGNVSSFWMLLRRMPNLRALLAAHGLGIIPLAFISLGVFLAAAVIGIRQNAQQRLCLAICVSSLVTYYFFFHDLSILALPIFVALNQSIARKDWLRAAMAAGVLSAFATFWFTQGKLYLGVLFSLAFFGAQAASMLKQANDINSAQN